MERFQNEIDSLKILLNIDKYKIDQKDIDLVNKINLPSSKFVKYVELKIFNIDRVKMPPVDEENPQSNIPKFKITLYTFVYKHLEINKLPLALTLNNSTILDAIMALCTKHGVDSLLISPPENTKSYSQILIPPLNFTNSMYYLQEVYGIYKHGLNLFFDFNYSYILRKDFLDKLPQIDLEPYDYEKVIFDIYPYNMETRFVNNNSTYIDNDNKSISILCKNNFSFNNSEITMKEAGEVFKLVSNGPQDESYNHHEILDNFESLSNPGNIVKTNETPKEIIKWKKYNNDFTITELQFKLKELMFNVSSILVDQDVEVYVPNKRFELIFKDDPNIKKYNGTYRLNNFIYKFKGTSKDFQSLICNLGFSKIFPEYVK